MKLEYNQLLSNARKAAELQARLQAEILKNKTVSVDAAVSKDGTQNLITNDQTIRIITPKQQSFSETFALPPDQSLFDDKSSTETWSENEKDPQTKTSKKSEKKHILQLDYDKQIDLLIHLAKEHDNNIDEDFLREILSTDEKSPHVMMEETCVPPGSIFFHKKHRSGSNSILPIFKYFTGKFNLVSASPYCGAYLGGYPGRIGGYGQKEENQNLQKYFGQPKFKKYQIIFNNMIFNKQAIQQLMYQPETTQYITMLRNPVDHFLSTFYYYYDKFPSADSFASRGHTEECWGSPFYPYLRHMHLSPDIFLSKLDLEGWEGQQGQPEVPFQFRGQNFQAFELGFNYKNNSDSYINSSISKLQQDFNLILISDYYFESVLLLKRHLCLSWIEIFTNFKNKQSYNYSKFSRKVTELIQKTHKLDFSIYEHFNNTFWENIKFKYPGGLDQMGLDVEKLKKIYKFCDKNKNLCRKLQTAVKIKARKENKGGATARSEKIEKILESEDILEKNFKDWLQDTKKAQGGNGCPFGKLPDWTKANQAGKLKKCPARAVAMSESDEFDNFNDDQNGSNLVDDFDF